ncbi:MAG: DUF3990 domain-containing protein [Bacteroidales bacterium]|nr:DUF3990 domain-containing protein [Candidatus Colicola caccequi]MBQ0154638.1 DUF3990 domain-containing protein [Candidatus Colicola equi]
MKLYHGSTVYIEQIDLQKSRPNKDFGRGFYLSADRFQAQRMGEFKALIEGGVPVMNVYEFDEAVLQSGELKVLRFEGYSREWAEFIFLNRNNPSKLPAHDYDIVYGPIANDRVGVQISKYEAGDITLEQFLENLKYMQGITYQYFFGTDKAIAKLKKL